MLTLTAVLLSLSLLTCGCAPSLPQQNQPDTTQEPYSWDGDVDTGLLTGFALELLKQCHTDSKNTLVSPLSVLSALAMTANGADGDTLSQTEAVLGRSVSELNTLLQAYLADQPDDLRLANSIWFTDDESFTVEQDFLDAAKRHFNAEVFRTDFTSATADEINRWVKGNTDGMIEDIIKEVPEDAVMYLINALAFEAEWASAYKDYQIKDGTFTASGGTSRQVTMMHSTEGQFITDGNATGFLKYYAGGKYAFAALLPNEGISIQQYLDSLTAERLAAALANPEEMKVYAAIPKFETEYSAELSPVLKAMGMTDAFDMEKANFSGICTSETGNLYISRVQHKTFFSIGELGTKAGAATSVEMAYGAILTPQEQETRTVTLDRPFVYMIIDCETNQPFFIGTMLDVEG